MQFAALAKLALVCFLPLSEVTGDKKAKVKKKKKTSGSGITKSSSWTVDSLFAEFDANADGKITLDEQQNEELKGRIPDANIFNTMDINQDGVVSKAEAWKVFDTMGPGASKETIDSTAAQMFKELDTNSDGKISLKEMKRMGKGTQLGDRAEQFFRTMDVNDDGHVTQQESLAMMRVLGQQMSQQMTGTSEALMKEKKKTKASSSRADKRNRKSAAEDQSPPKQHAARNPRMASKETVMADPDDDEEEYVVNDEF